MGWFIVDIEGGHSLIGYNFEKIKLFFLSLKIDLVIANSVDPDEMPHKAAFLLGLRCLLKYLIRGFQYTKSRVLFFVCLI